MLVLFKYRFLLVVCIGVCSISMAQDKSNKGKEFWLGYGHNVLFTQDNPINSQTHVLYLSAEQAATVTVSVNGTGWSQTVNIPANTVDFSINIPKTGPDDARLLTEGLSTKGIHVVSNVPIVAYSHQYGLFSSGATMLMPVETFGYTYYSLNYTQVSNYPDSYSWFYTVASENNTRLLITPSDSTEGGWLPNQTYTVNLNKGEIYNVFGRRTSTFSSKDMTGSKVVSVPGADGNCHPVAVFSGSSRNIVCAGNGGEFLQQQIFPANAWGTKYITYHTVNNPGGNITTPFLNHYRIAVRNPATVVKRNGVVLTGLINNFYYQFSSNSGDYIEADQPVLVAQYTVSSNECTGVGANPLGDPEMIYISPIEQGVKNAIFYNTRNQAISLSFVNIIIPSPGISSLLIDGVPPDPTEYITHPVNSNYSVVVKRLTGAGAQHSISSDSTFIATNYGVGITESYGYNVGTLVNNLNAYSQIKNTFNTTGNIDTFTCPKTPFRLFVKLAYQPTSIQWKLSQVTGITPNTDSIISNPLPVATQTINGRTYNTYTLQQDFSFAAAGTYYIPVSYTAPDIDNCNQTENSTIKVVVKPGPVADFSISPLSCLRDTVYFTAIPATSSFNISSYLWNFDDASTQTTINAKKKFAVSGNQNIRYRIYADNGCAGDTTKSISIFPEPVVRFGATTPSCDSVRVSDTTTINGGAIRTWWYGWGDGTITATNSSLPFYHVYNVPGTYIIKHTALSMDNCISDTAYQAVTILGKPLAKFGFDRNVCLGDSILFSDSSTVATGTITTRQWDLGDGNFYSPATNAPFYHKYTAAGNYTVSLIVTGSNGCGSNVFRLTVNVNTRPAATFTISGKPCIDSLQTFSSSIPTATPGPPIWNWNFGDGQTFNSAATNTASHAYAASLNNVTVKHWVSYSAGCSSDTAFVVIPLINPNPVASFTLVGDTLCEKKPLLFSSAVTGVSSWNWNLGDGASNAVPPFAHAYTSANIYAISLVVRTIAGCGSLPVTQNITINPKPAVNAGPDKFITAGASTTLDATIGNPANYSYQWIPSLYLDNATILNPVSTPDAPVIYTIRAFDKISNCMGEDNVVVTPVSDLYVPSGFTPNNDGKNDKWVIPGLALYPEARVMVFNRWGEKIIDTKQYINNPWDGTYKKLIQPNGVYVYLIRLPDPAKKPLKGTVVLIR